MTEPLLNDARVHPCAQGKGRVGVPQVVKPNPR